MAFPCGKYLDYSAVNYCGEKKKVKADIDFLEGKLSNENFVSKAPEKLINETKDKLAVAKEKMERIEESIKMLG